MTSEFRSVRAGWLRPLPGAVLAVGVATAMVVASGVAGVSPAAAQSAEPTVGLGTAASFAVLAGSTVTNTGPSVISGDLGVSPGSAVTGFPPGLVINGTQHRGDAVAEQAQSDLTTAYNDAAGRSPATAVATELGGRTFTPGVYSNAGELGLTGTVTLDAQGDPNAVFIFQAGSTLITASNSRVALIGAARACNVFWQVGSSATLGTDTTFVGNVLALTSVTVQTATTVDGRVLARNGQVSLDDNRITRPNCDDAPPVVVVPPITIPPITIPPVIPGLPPIVVPPITVPPIVVPPTTTPVPTTPPGGDNGGDNDGDNDDDDDHGDNDHGDNDHGDNDHGDNGGDNDHGDHGDNDHGRDHHGDRDRDHGDRGDHGDDNGTGTGRGGSGGDQVKVKPGGGVDTGDGSIPAAGYLLGGLAVSAAGGCVFAARLALRRRAGRDRA